MERFTNKMTARENVKNILSRKGGGGAFWTGHPNTDTIPIYADAWGIEPTREAIYNFLGDDCRWVMADAAYRHPDGGTPFNRGAPQTHASLADAETTADVDKFPWPDVKYLDFTDAYAEIGQYPDKMVFTGMWSSFFHTVADMFGMEDMFIKMHENPIVVTAAFERVVDFYVRANDIFLGGLNGCTDVMFFGNDFGTQLDLLISPGFFRRFVLPGFKRIIDVGKKHGMIVMLHSCGSIYKIIPDLIDAGVDALHPIQAQAAGMDARSLVQYKNDLAFAGGIDAQSFFVDASPMQIKNEVWRVRDLLEPNLVVSPSHEEILPNVPAANVLAMAEAARG